MSQPSWSTNRRILQLTLFFLFFQTIILLLLEHRVWKQLYLEQEHWTQMQIATKQAALEAMDHKSATTPSTDNHHTTVDGTNKRHHLRLSTKGAGTGDVEVKTNLAQEQHAEQVRKPQMNGKPRMSRGTTRHENTTEPPVPFVRPSNETEALCKERSRDPVQASPIKLPGHVPEGKRPPWCLDVPVNKSKNVYLAETMYARIYAEDAPKLTRRDLVHWLTYQRYAGVERVYLYDNYLNQSEIVLDDPDIQAAIRSGFVVYTDFHKRAARWQKSFIIRVQARSYGTTQRVAQGNTRWCGFYDMDEYPFVMEDQTPGFLARYLFRKEQLELEKEPCGRSTQFTMDNFIVEGGREDNDEARPLLIQQIPRLSKKPSNRLVKQFVRLDATKEHDVHHSSVIFGNTTSFPAEELQMKHFWGGRLLNWKRVDELSQEKREELLARSVVNQMADLPEQVLRCYDAHGGHIEPLTSTS